MKTSPFIHKSTRSHLNVMELLVQEEIQKQLKSYPSNLRAYINTIEVATYALNRLPAFYASSQKGKEQQLKEARKHKDEIIHAVRRALAAVERDPLRQSQPLITEQERNYQKADEALHSLEAALREKRLLDQGDLSWENLSTVVLRSLNKLTGNGEEATDILPIPRIVYRKQY